MKQIRKYTAADGTVPFEERLEDCDERLRAKICAYVDRVALGAAGNVKRLKNASGVLEIRIDWGPGYRVYYGEVGKNMMLLLLVGTKKRQAADIGLAREYWRSYHAKASIVR
ncbi:MAG: type II toxin-antitoxin system RelE/ParE family toxin [Pseudomonadota bacterium]